MALHFLQFHPLGQLQSQPLQQNCLRFRGLAYAALTDRYPAFGRHHHIDVVAPPFQRRGESIQPGPSREVGQHNEEDLLEPGCSWADIVGLRERGAFQWSVNVAMMVCL
ncbi:MAG: hypothetical protein Q7O66_22080 [Dehalococcoidia bacterium]|nr:hypothetical protein [Dehalococcoidia bacterium]